MFCCNVEFRDGIEHMPWMTGDNDAKFRTTFRDPPPQEFQAGSPRSTEKPSDAMTATAREFGRPMIVGIDREHFGAQGRETFNSAVLITPDGKWCEPGRIEQSYYDKMHLVPFGEYMPFAKSLPWLQSLSPLGSEFQSGRAAQGLHAEEHLPGAEHLL